MMPHTHQILHIGTGDGECCPMLSRYPYATRMIPIPCCFLCLKNGMLLVVVLADAFSIGHIGPSRAAIPLCEGGRVCTQ